MKKEDNSGNKIKLLIPILLLILIIVVILCIINFLSDDIRDENPYEIYGKYVNYSSDGIDTNVKWRIYYTDNQNIFLIADKNAEEIVLTQNIEEYSGSQDVNKSEYSKYLLWSQNNAEATNNNVKSVAYLVDTNKWNKYAQNVATEYAVGASSVDMLVCSYNKLYENKLICELGKNGYNVKFENEKEIQSSLKLSEIQYDVSKRTPYEDLFNYENDGSSETLVNAWIASNSNYNSETMFQLNKTLCNDVDCNETSGIRPVICLKSATRLKLRDDGTYDIVYNVWTQIQEKIRNTFKLSNKNDVKFSDYVTNSLNNANTETSYIDSSMNKYEIDDLIYGLPKNYEEDYGLPYDVKAGIDSGNVYYCYDAPEGVEYYCFYITSFDADIVPETSYSEVCVNEMCNAIAYYSEFYDINKGPVSERKINDQTWLTRKVDASPNAQGVSWNHINDTEFFYVTKYNGKMYYVQFWNYGKSGADWNQEFEKIINTFNFK